MRSKWLALLIAGLTIGTAVPRWAQAEEHEKVVSIDKIPAPARAALIREAKGAAILRVEVEAENNQTVYEGVIKSGDEEIGINVDANGKVLGRHSEKGERDEHK